jgi:hypothetical protein
VTEPAVLDAPADTGDSSGTGAVAPTSFPKIQDFKEDSDIVHYAPEAHEVPDPAQRDS